MTGQVWIAYVLCGVAAVLVIGFVGFVIGALTRG